MRFSAYKSDFADALQAASVAVAVKPMTPILSCVLLTASDSILELQTNDHEKACIVRILVNVEVEGSVAVSCKRLQDFIKNLPDDTVTCKLEDNYLILESGGATVELLTIPPAEFPKIKRVEDAACKIDVPANELKAMINRTVFAVAKDETNPIFTGVNFQVTGEDTFQLVATNTHRLALQGHGKLQTTLDADTQQFAVRADILRGLAALIQPKSIDNVKIAFDFRHVEFFFANVLYVARLIEGNFPPIDRVIPKETATHIKVDTAAFRDALNFVTIMAKETEFNTVILTLNNAGMAITATSKEIGESTVNVEAEFSGEDLKIAFNVQYLIDVLKVIDSPNVLLDFNDRYSPCKITAGDPNYIYVATPMRV